MRIALLVLATVLAANPQGVREVPGNLLLNPHADAGGSGWQTYGEATVEEQSGDPCFVIRNKGVFEQTVNLPLASGGLFLVVLGRASSERINPDGAITGLPYLYGLMGNRRRILGYLTGPDMRSRASTPNEWSSLWGIFQVPEGTESVVFQLKQAERLGVAQNGSAARFDDLAFVVVRTRGDAEALARTFCMKPEHVGGDEVGEDGEDEEPDA